MFHSRILRYVDETARRGSIRQAAEALNVSSSSINRQIIDLEKRLGAPLFERLPRTMRLTAAGEILVDHFRQTLRNQDRVMYRIAELQGVGRGRIRVATMNGLASGFLPRLCRTFAMRYPGIHFEVHNQRAGEIIDSVETGEVDFGLGYNLQPTPNQRVVRLYQARLGVVVARAHPLAIKTSVRLSDLLDFAVVLANDAMTIRPVIDAACQKAGVKLRIPFESNSIQLMKYLVGTGQAVTFLSLPDVSSEVDEQRFSFIPLRDRIPLNPLMIVQRAAALGNPNTDVFLQDLMQRLDVLLPDTAPS